MRTKTVTKLVRNLTPDEYKKCKSLNFRYNGCMMYDLPMSKVKHPDSARVVMIKEAESGRLIAWALAIPRGDKYNTQYYTRVSYRGQGYGSRLIRHVLKFTDKPLVCPHDTTSRRFFKRHQKDIEVNSLYTL